MENLISHFLNGLNDKGKGKR